MGKEKVNVQQMPQEKHKVEMGELEEGERKITRNQKRKHDEINHVQKVRIGTFRSCGCRSC